MSLTPETTELVIEMLREKQPGYVPGFMRKLHNVIISHEEVRAIFRSHPPETFGRERVKLYRLAANPPASWEAFAPSEDNQQLMARFDATLDTVARWRRETAIPCPATSNLQINEKLAVPADFKTVAPTMLLKALMVHYNVGRNVMRRWLLETGATYMPAKQNKPFVHRVPAGSMVDAVRRDTSSEGLAADFLRKLGPVYRCTAKGRPDPRGSHWARGRAVLTGQQIVERAVERGFDPHAWQRVA